MDVLQKVLLIFLITILQSYVFADSNKNCSYAFYSRAKTFIHKSATGLPDSRKCEWRITVASDEKIILNITDMFIPKSINCSQGAVEVRDGYWHTSPLLGRFCGGDNTSLNYFNTVLSTSNKMLISYNNLNVGIDQRFVASYEGICGETFFVENSTTFSSPNYPSIYPLNKKCLWRIVVPEDYRVALTFTSFSVEYQSNCLYDYVQLKEGPLLNGRLIGTYCNGNLPSSTILSRGNEILVKFVSDYSLPLRGFQATVTKDIDECDKNIHGCAQLCINTIGSYRCACRHGWELHSNGKSCEIACGGNLTLPTGRITSPSYPYNYPSNSSCIWKIKTLYESMIRLNFDQFSLENGVSNGTSVQCNKDWFKVSSTGRGNSLVTSSRCQGNLNIYVVNFHGTFCGSTRPNPITSEGNELTLAFNSDATIERNGFAITYATELKPCLINNGNCHHACLNISGSFRCQCVNNFIVQENGLDCANSNCLFEISSPSGVINSPNYPNNYPTSKNCAWKFRTTPGHRLNLTFLAFQLENNSACNYDNVILYDGLSTTNTTLGKFCGSVIPNQINSSTNELYVTFRSDGSNVFKGFQATYATVCGGNLTADSREKYIYSHPNFGHVDYENGLFCEWKIKAPAGKKISVKFLSFFLESGACNYDYVEILDGPNSNSLSLGRYCWHDKPQRICSRSNGLVIRFRTDMSVTSRGFSLVYQASD